MSETYEKPLLVDVYLRDQKRIAELEAEKAELIHRCDSTCSLHSTPTHALKTHQFWRGVRSYSLFVCSGVRSIGH